MDARQRSGWLYRHLDNEAAKAKYRNDLSPIYDLDEIQAKYDTIVNVQENSPNLVKNFETLKTFISKIDEDMMESIFGNHVRVAFTRDSMKFEIDGHDHD